MKKDMFKKVLVLALSLVMVFAFVACGGSDAPAEAAETEEATVYYVGTEPTFPPFEFTDEATGDIVGFDIDLIRAIAADQGFEVEIQNLGFDGLIPALQSGNISIAASGMTITPEREEVVDFTTPYINAGLAVAVTEGDTEIKGVEDLTGKVASVQIGTTGANKAQELLDAGVLADVRTFNTVDVVMLELVNGGADVVINDLPVTEAYIAKQPGEIKIVGEPLTSESYGFAIKAGNTELLEMINTGLANVMENGVYDELQVKYFN